MVTSENKYVDCCYILPFVLKVFFNTQPRMKTKESDKMTILNLHYPVFLPQKNSWIKESSSLDSFVYPK